MAELRLQILATMSSRVIGLSFLTTAKLTTLLFLVSFLQLSALANPTLTSPSFMSMPQPPHEANRHHRPPFNLRVALVFTLIIIFFVMLAFIILRYRYLNRRHGRTVEEPDMSRQGAEHLRLGLDSSIISKFPTYHYSAAKGNASNDCVVCLGTFEDCETIRLLTTCGHVFHADCIDMWFASHTTCPLCRVNLDKQDDIGWDVVKNQQITEQSRSQRMEPLHHETTETESHEIALLNASICSSSSGLERIELHRLNPRGVTCSSLRFPDNGRVNGPQVNRCKSDMVLHTSMD